MKKIIFFLLFPYLVTSQVDCSKMLAFGNTKDKLSKHSISIKKAKGISEIYVRGKLILSKEISSRKHLVYEWFDNKYFVLSTYSNIGAAGPELMERDVTYVIPLASHDIIAYKIDINYPVRFTFCKETLKPHFKSKDLIYAIENIDSETISLISNKNLKEKHTLTPLKLPIQF